MASTGQMAPLDPEEEFQSEGGEEEKGRFLNLLWECESEGAPEEFSYNANTERDR